MGFCAWRHSNRPASLAIINNQEESDFIQSVSTDLLWTGLKRSRHRRCVCLGYGDAVDWTDWGPDEPNKNGGTEDVVVMNWQYEDGSF